MYESKFLEQLSSFADVIKYVEEQSKKQHIFGVVDVFESSYSPNRSFFYGKLLGAIKLFQNALAIEKKEPGKDDRLLFIICYTLFRHGADFYPPMPNKLQYRYQAPTIEKQKQVNAYRNNQLFKEEQKLEYEAQFSKIGRVLANDKIRLLFENAKFKGEVCLSTQAHSKFQSFSKTLLTKQERTHNAASLTCAATQNQAHTGFNEFQLEPSFGTTPYPPFPVATRTNSFFRDDNVIPSKGPNKKEQKKAMLSMTNAYGYGHFKSKKDRSEASFFDSPGAINIGSRSFRNS